MIEPSALELDALTEIFNIGVGIAADALYQMVGEHVPLSVPVVELTSQRGANSHYLAREQRQYYAIDQTYAGEFHTDARLMFPQESSLALVRMMAGPDLAEEELAGMAEDALAELGNIILNAVISNLASSLEISLEGSLPQVSLISSQAVFANDAPADGSADDSAPVLALMIDFQLGSRQVSGYLAFLLDESSSRKLLERIQRYVLDPSA